MKIDIDNMTSAAGWNGSSVKASVYGINELPEYIAGLNDKSIIFKFDADSENEYIEKEIEMDLSDYDEVVFWIWSRNIKGKGISYKESSEYAYKIDFGTGTGKEFYIPIAETFSDMTISIKVITNITRVRITCLHNQDDYIIMSNMIATKDEFPVDIWRSVKEQLENDILSAYPKLKDGVNEKGIYLGKITANKDDTSIILPDVIKIAERYSVILIDDDINSEIHQLDKNDGLEYTFFSTYDGTQILNDYVDAGLYLKIPVEYGMTESEIILPGINIYGMAPEEIIDSSKIDHARDTFDLDETVSERKADAKFRYNITIDCEARTNEMIAFMSLIVRYFLARQILWVNGKRIEILPESGSNYIDAIEAFNQIPKIQYIVIVEIREEVYDRVKLYETIQSNRTFNIRRLQNG